MRILGIDPGLATVGIGLIESRSSTDFSVVEWLTIETKAGLPLPDRLKEIREDLAAYLQENKPDLAVIEKLFFATNERTAIDVAQARGVIVVTVAEHNIPIIEATPLQMKLGVTGDGKADKLQVQTMLLHLLKLQEIPRPDDAADALALAIYGALQQTKIAELGMEK
ncbi:MAG TPA: crossover junction endodeoxyribonuclease RuvC [Candidatus Peribacteraceae bacterium]|nr:crossover junction endodeoxyribonuclease RuvC [Candidatus Peribacteraceae bacterium]